MEDPNSGELFACCPVPYGQRGVAVEQVADSSRYFVLRVEDPGTRRHAFLGMGFDERSDAFDFTEALIRHEQQAARERAAAVLSSSPSGSSPGTAAAGTAPRGSPQPAAGPGHDAAAAGFEPVPGGAAAGAASRAEADLQLLYRSAGDLRLQEGQTIRVNVSGLKKTGAGAGGGTGKGLLISAPGAASPLAAPLPAAGPVAVPDPGLGTAPAWRPLAPPPGQAAQASAVVNTVPWDSSLPAAGPTNSVRVSGTSQATGGAGSSMDSGPATFSTTTAIGANNWATFD